MNSAREIMRQAEGCRRRMVVDRASGLSCFDRLLESFPDDGMVFLKRAEGHEAHGDSEQAHQDFRRAHHLLWDTSWKQTAADGARRTASRPSDIGAPELSEIYAGIVAILDSIEGTARQDRLADRITRLRDDGRLPSATANQMHTLRLSRNTAVHEGETFTGADAEAISANWAAVKGWALSTGHRHDDSSLPAAQAESEPATLDQHERVAVARGAPREVVVSERLTMLERGFERYLEVFDRRGPFHDPRQLSRHRETLERLRALGSAAAACRDREFCALLQSTLSAWGIGSRNAAPVSPEAFRASLSSQARALVGLEGLSLEDPELDIGRVIAAAWDIIARLRLAVSREGRPLKAPLVSGSKALHHLLPELIMPIDRQYTQAFFGWRNPEFQYHQEQRFAEIFTGLARVARAVRPSQYVGGGWRTGSAKIVDNALVGFCIAESVEKTQ